MRGIQYVTNEKGERIALMINLKDHDNSLEQYIEDLLDIIRIEERKDEESQSWSEVKKELKENGKLD